MTYELTLRHVAEWDRLDGRTGKIIGACFVGGPLEPGRSLTMPGKVWDDMGRPEVVTMTVKPVDQSGVEQ